MRKILLKSVVVGLGCVIAISALAVPGPKQKPLVDHLPLYFTAASSGSHAADFVANGVDCQFVISPTEAQVELQKADAGTGKISLRRIGMQFIGADSRAQLQGANELPGKVNYLVGNNPAQWNTGVATFARLRVERLYRGISLVYYGNQRHLEYDLTVAPDARPDSVRIRFSGVRHISIGSQGDLILEVGGSEIRQPAPVIYQTVQGQRRMVRGGYRLMDRQTIGFTIGNYDHRWPLVIDPVLNFSTYFGGNSGESASSVALDTNGFIYVAGNTLSSQFPTNSRPNGFQTSFAGGSLTGDAFVAKFDNQGSNLIYFTYLGGNADDSANDIVVDSAGHAFITGFTDSANFPTTTNALSRNIGGPPTSGGYFVDAFVAELNPGGSNLVYSTYLGGSGPDSGNSIAVDASDDIYVTGYTCSTNFPVSSNAFQDHLASSFSIYTSYLHENAFVTEIGASGTNVIYSSYLGGTNFDTGKGIAVDSSNDVYVAGYSSSTNFPTANAIFQQFVQTNVIGTTNVIVTNILDGSLLNGSTGQTAENQSTPSDAFVAEFAPGCTNLIYSTLLGGTNNDVANGIAVDAAGNAYVTGWTVSTNFPNTANVAGLYNGLARNTGAGLQYVTNAFLTQVSWNGTNAAVGFSTVFGGTNFGIDMGNGVTLDSCGNIYVVGSSSTTNFPAVNTPGLLGTTNVGGSDAFVIAFAPGLCSILYSGYLGGSGNDYGYGIAADSATNVYLAGQTASTRFPIFNARQSTLDGSSDAFLAKIGWVNELPLITTQPTNQAVVVGTSVSLIAAATGTAPLTYQWQELGTNSTWTNVVNRGNSSGATNATLTISNAQTTNSGDYQLIVANTAGSVTSAVVNLAVTNAFPLITTQPTNQIVGVGGGALGYVSFSATVSGGTSPVRYQWMKDGTNLVNGGANPAGAAYPYHIYGATNTTLYVVDPQTNDAGTYWLVITNPAGVVTSSNATLTVTEAPIITEQPTNQTVGLGSQVSFAATVVGSSPLSYQWLFEGTNLTDGPNIGGSTNATLVLTNAQISNNGPYVLIVTNSFGSATSAPPAVLTVLTVPTFMNITAGADGRIVFSGTGGTNGATYYVYASTNLATPLNQWTPVQVNGSQFGSQGQFSFTNTPPANTPQRFYILETPSP